MEWKMELPYTAGNRIIQFATSILSYKKNWIAERAVKLMEKLHKKCFTCILLQAILTIF